MLHGRSSYRQCRQTDTTKRRPPDCGAPVSEPQTMDAQLATRRKDLGHGAWVVYEPDFLQPARAEDLLERRKVDVVWGTDDSIAVRGELQDGDRVITSAMATPIEGMPLRVMEPALGAGEAADTDSEAM